MKTRCKFRIPTIFSRSTSGTSQFSISLASFLSPHPFSSFHFHFTLVVEERQMKKSAFNAMNCFIRHHNFFVDIVKEMASKSYDSIVVLVACCLSNIFYNISNLDLFLIKSYYWKSNTRFILPTQSFPYCQSIVSIHQYKLCNVSKETLSTFHQKLFANCIYAAIKEKYFIKWSKNETQKFWIWILLQLPTNKMGYLNLDNSINGV